MSFLLLGQTDAGKSTIAGHLLYKCGFFRTVDDSKGKSKWSILLDTSEDEQESGKTKTHEFSFYDFVYRDKNYTLVDTPGHLLYIRTLIEGLYSRKIDVICLVISSVQDEFNLSFERGTVKEDLLLARSVGCPNLAVLWNKTDIQLRTIEMEKELEEYIKKLKYKNVSHFNVSGLTGNGLTDFLEFIETNKTEEKVENGPENNNDKVEIQCCFHIPKQQNIVLTKGFFCVLHHLKGERECEIIKIDKQIVISDCICKISVKLNKKLSYKKGDKIIFRKNTFTIGYGNILG